MGMSTAEWELVEHLRIFCPIEMRLPFGGHVQTRMKKPGAGKREGRHYEGRTTAGQPWGGLRTCPCADRLAAPFSWALWFPSDPGAVQPPALGFCVRAQCIWDEFPFVLCYLERDLFSVT